MFISHEVRRVVCFGSEPAVFRQVKIVDWTELAKELAFFSFLFLFFFFHGKLSLVTNNFHSMSQLYEPEKKGRPQNGGGKTPLHR